MSKIVVVDMDSGNLHSVAKAVQSVSDKNNQVIISQDLDIITAADKLIVPGQGAINTWMHYFNRLNKDDILLNAIKNKPVFGICVGMQAMFSSAEEGANDDDNIKPLSLFDGHVARFQNNELTIPQMGWNRVSQKPHSASNAIWQGIDDNAWFYFAHSYHITDDDKQYQLGSTEYGVNYTSVTARDNIVAVQFHPEKSQNNGLKIIQNFLNWQP